MKPNEEHDGDEQNVIVQLGMLILKGRSNGNTQISGNAITSELVKNEDVSFYCEKEGFLSLWKCCEILFIEVWLHHDKQFNEEEAVQSHSGYLLMEQWQLEMTKNSSSETGFHCTGKMLMQAIKSKLYFSQLSAWLSLSKGEFPRYTHFRLCQNDDRVPLQRFCKPPEFHQFPRVPISCTKELQVTLNSLPRFDISKEHPVFSWVLADSETENLTRTKVGNDGPCDCESACLVRNKNRFGTSGIDCTTSNAVRKLEFPEANREKQTGIKCHEGSKERFSWNQRPCSWSDCQGTSSMTGPGHLTSTEMAPRSSLHACGVGKTVRGTPFCQCGGNSSGECDPEILVKCSALERGSLFSSHVTAVDNIDDFGKENLETATSNEKRTNLDSSTSYPIVFNSDSMCVNVGSFEKTKNLDSSTFSNSNLGSNSDTVGNYDTPFKASDRTNCRNCSQRKLSDFDDIKCGLEERFTEKSCSSKKPGVAVSDTQCSFKFEAARTSDLEEKLRKTWTFMKEAHVLPKMKKDFDDVPASVRLLIEEGVKRKLNEELWKCLSPEKRCLHGDHLTSDRHKDSREGGESSKDIVFPDQRSTVTCHAQLDSRHHFRHASTGTLPVFHPSTGLPVSSSPAPFRKPRGLSPVNDIDSSFNLQNLSSELSRSAPTLTTQSLLGNFEESILNDRLLPDGVVEGFSAELSASSSRKCLAHVTLPVEAYFFKLSDDDAPSPYMGYISLDVPGLPRKGYHVPKKGTIQLTLFNPNQTVVKVFVVLYDFSDMQPNFRTFLRQRTTSLVESDTLVDRNHDNLHYLVHLRFASSKSGRVYLHTDIRVIFARHPPDQVYVSTSTSGPTNPKYVPKQET